MAYSYTTGHLNRDTIAARIKKRVTGTLFAVLWSLTPGLIRSIMFKQFFTPKRTLPTSEQERLISEARSFERVVNNDLIQCWQWGEGPALLCVHGWNGIGAQLQQFIEYAVDNNCSVIAFDGPAHGQSKGKTCSYFQMTDVVRMFLSDNQYQIKGIIGHSFGAGAIVNGLDKERKKIPTVLIAPALEFNRIIEGAFSYYGVSEKIVTDLIGQYEREYGYSFRADDPVRLLDNNAFLLMVIHDQEDIAFSFDRTKQIIEQFPTFQWVGTKGLGHKKILADPHVIQTAFRFLIGKEE